MSEHDPDFLMRLEAFEQVRALNETQGSLSAADLRLGFMFRGERIPLVNPQRGIFKPRRMRYLLSIRTVVPRHGGRVWYDDQREAHRQIFEGEEAVAYAFMGTNPEAADNRWLRDAYENGIAIIYFLGTVPGRYQAMAPTYIVGWNRQALKVEIAFGVSGQEGTVPESAVERRYALRTVKRRLHQGLFREAIMTAYNGRCAVSGLPETRLLDAAHIISDKSELLGQPVVPNGLPLSKTHHAAFDAHLLGVDPNYRLHVSDRLLAQTDGPMLESLKQLDRQALHLPSRQRDYPDRDRLALRFEQFEAAA